MTTRRGEARKALEAAIVDQVNAEVEFACTYEANPSSMVESMRANCSSTASLVSQAIDAFINDLPPKPAMNTVSHVEWELPAADETGGLSLRASVHQGDHEIDMGVSTQPANEEICVALTTAAARWLSEALAEALREKERRGW